MNDRWRRGLPGLAVLALGIGLTACAEPSRPVAADPTAPPARPGPPASPPVSSTSPAPAWRDLNGARAGSGEGELQRRGFELSRQQGLTAFWNHAPSQTCLRVVTNQGRYNVSQVPFTPQNCPLR